MARKNRQVGQFEDPDLVPVMNMVCVLIPLMLWITTWATFGQITASGGVPRTLQLMLRAAF